MYLLTWQEEGNTLLQRSKRLDYLSPDKWFTYDVAIFFKGNEDVANTEGAAFPPLLAIRFTFFPCLFLRFSQGLPHGFHRY